MLLRCKPRLIFFLRSFALPLIETFIPSFLHSPLFFSSSDTYSFFHSYCAVLFLNTFSSPIHRSNPTPAISVHYVPHPTSTLFILPTPNKTPHHHITWTPHNPCTLLLPQHTQHTYRTTPPHHCNTRLHSKPTLTTSYPPLTLICTFTHRHSRFHTKRRLTSKHYTHSRIRTGQLRRNNIKLKHMHTHTPS